MAEADSAQSKGGGTRPVSILDIDFLVFALPYALLIDALDFALSFGTIISLIVGGPLIAWMVWRAGKSSVGRKDIKQRQAARQAAKTAGKKMLKRGVLIFIVELIPIINLIPFWTVAIIFMLKSVPSPQNAVSQAKTQPAKSEASA